MTPDEHTHDAPHDTQPGDLLDTDPNALDPLLDDATATIYFDGLIYVAYNERQKLFQAAVLTEAEGHELVIEVKERGKKELIWPLEPSDWNPDHQEVKKRAPFWLYVDSGQGISKGPFSAELYRLEDKNDEKSFANVFNFQEEYQRPTVIKAKTFAEFNFPHGISYSADNKPAILKAIKKGQPLDTEIDKGPITVSARAALDINAVSNRDSKKSIVLVGDGGKSEFFRFELDPAKQYEISLFNQPKGSHHRATPGEPPDPRKHFLQFYELVQLKDDELQYYVTPDIAASEQSPPCVTTTGGGKGGLGGGG